MRRIIGIIIGILIVFAPLSATTQASEQTQELPVSLTASGSRTALKLDEETCQFGFPGLVDDPAIEIVTTDNVTVSSTPLGTGDWSMPGDVAFCKQTYSIEVPTSGEFEIRIAPYLLLKIEDGGSIPSEGLEIDLSRESGDPFPISPLPQSGPIDGTDDIRIIGLVELTGEAFKDFIVSPIGGCMGMGGYSDISAGAQVTIRDQSGEIVGLGELLPDPRVETPDKCSFYFSVEVPESKFYTVDMGRRGELSYSHSDLEHDEFQVKLSIGR